MSRYELRLARSARRHIAEIQRWWVENRPAAPGLFDEELAATLEQIAAFPTVGKPHPLPSGRPTRRILMRRSGYNVFYSVDQAARVGTVVAVWHTARGSGPPLT